MVAPSPSPAASGATGTLRVLEVQRMSTEDGPGIRTTVFLSGCSLACRWCQNPESIPQRPPIVWFGERCIGCGICIAECPQGAIERGPEGPVRHPDRCRHCGTCLQACPPAAWEQRGRTVAPRTLLAELLQDRTWYRHSGGGVTFSGGEPALQAPALAPLLDRLGQEGIHRALDTCGQVPRRSLERLLSRVELVCYDLKLLDPHEHRRFTGHDNDRILRNLGRVFQECAASGGPTLWIRTPLIPGATAKEPVIRQLGHWLREQGAAAVDRWELCAFNALCRDKYRRLGVPWDYAETPHMARAELDRLEQVARRAFGDAERVHVTGASRPTPDVSPGEEAPCETD